MRQRKVTEYICEGCGHSVLSEKELNEIKPHYRQTDKIRVDSEEGCIERTAKINIKEEEERKKREQNYKLLINACTSSKEFQTLCNLYPDEDGEGSDWIIFDMVLDKIALENNISVENLTLGCSSGFHTLLRKCITEARKQI